MAITAKCLPIRQDKPRVCHMDCRQQRATHKGTRKRSRTAFGRSYGLYSEIGINRAEHFTIIIIEWIEFQGNCRKLNVKFFFSSLLLFSTPGPVINEVCNMATDSWYISSTNVTVESGHRRRQEEACSGVPQHA